MVGIMDSYHASDFMDGFIGGQKQLFSYFHPSVVQILDGRNPIVFGKFAADTVFADGIGVFQFVQGIILHILRVK